MAHEDIARNAAWTLLTAQVPGREPVSAGILVLDPVFDELHIKLLPQLLGAEDDLAEFWRELPRDLIEQSRTIGGRQVLRWLETTASHVLQLGPRDFVETTNPGETLDLLYRRYVVCGANIEEPIARVC